MVVNERNQIVMSAKKTYDMSDFFRCKKHKKFSHKTHLQIKMQKKSVIAVKELRASKEASLSSLSTAERFSLYLKTLENYQKTCKEMQIEAVENEGGYKLW